MTPGGPICSDKAALIDAASPPAGPKPGCSTPRKGRLSPPRQLEPNDERQGIGFVAVAIQAPGPALQIDVEASETRAVAESAIITQNSATFRPATASRHTQPLTRPDNEADCRLPPRCARPGQKSLAASSACPYSATCPSPSGQSGGSGKTEAVGPESCAAWKDAFPRETPCRQSVWANASTLTHAPSRALNRRGPMNTVSHAEPESRLFNRNLVHYLGGWALFAFAGQGVMGVLLNLYFVQPIRAGVIASRGCRQALRIPASSPDQAQRQSAKWRRRLGAL